MMRTPLAARDWGKPLWGAIGLYVVSLALWIIVSLILIMVDLKDPVRQVAMLWGMTYPLTLIIGLVAAVIARVSNAWTAYHHSLLIPLYVTGLAVVMAIIVITGAQIEKSRLRAEFWRDPPVHISALKRGTSFAGVVEEPEFANVFFLPDDTTKANLIEWDGQMLFFQTTLAPKEVEEFYKRVYTIMDFDLTSLGGGDVYSDFGYRISEQTHFVLMIGDDEKQPNTRVGIVTCHDLKACWHLEWTEWEKSSP